MFLRRRIPRLPGGQGAGTRSALIQHRWILGGLTRAHSTNIEESLPSIYKLADMKTEEVAHLMDHSGGAMSLDWTASLCAHMKYLKPLPKPLVMYILQKSMKMFEQQENVLDLHCGSANDQPSKLTVVGDTHGQFWDVMHLFSDSVAGFPSPSNPFLFNGDMVDRGMYSFEVIFALLAIKVASPRAVEILRGNHETSDMNAMYGFEKQVLAAYDEEVLRATRDVMMALPIGAIINDKAFVVHGGLGKETYNMSIAQINEIDRFVDSPRFPSALSELLWSDPSDKITGLSRNKQRGAGWLFGKEATQIFLHSNGLELLIRSHEVRMNGFTVHHDGLCVTIFSAPNYCDNVGNLGAVLQFSVKGPADIDEDYEESPIVNKSEENERSCKTSGDDAEKVELSVLQFKSVPHPHQKINETNVGQ